MNPILFSILILVFFSLGSYGQSKTYEAVSPGLWSDESTWGTESPGFQIGFADSIFLNRNVILNEDLKIDGVVVVEEGVTIYSSKSFSIGASGTLINKGQLILEELESSGVVQNFNLIKTRLETLAGIED